MMREYECATCGRKNTTAPGEPLAVRECGRGCGQVFCAGCLPDHETVCGREGELKREIRSAKFELGSSVPDGTGSSVDFDEQIGG